MALPGDALGSFMSLVASAPLAQEFCLLCFFCLGFALCRTRVMKSIFSPRRGQASAKVVTLKQLRGLLAEQSYEEVLDAWPLLEEFTSEALSAVVAALLALNRPEDVGLFFSKAAANLTHLRSSLFECVRDLADMRCKVTADCLSLALQDVFRQSLAALDHRASLELLVAFASTDDEHHARELIRHLESRSEDVPSETRVAVVQGFLSCGNLQAALCHLPAVLRNRAASSEEVLAQTAAAVEEDCSTEPGRAGAVVFLDLLQSCDWPSEAAEASVLRGATAPGDQALYERARAALASRGVLSLESLDAVIRADLAFGNVQGAEGAFNRLVDCYPAAPEALLGGLLSAAGTEASLLESMHQWAMSHDRVALASAAANALSATRPRCNSESLQAERTTSPRDDSSTAVPASGESDCECEGSVSKHWSEDDGKASEAPLDNAALDAAVTEGCAESAHRIFEAMKRAGRLNVISCNIMLKLNAGRGFSQHARALLEEMAEYGLRPNTATYNSIISGALSHGDVDFAWRTIDGMERSGPSPDAYTVSILFKGCKSRHGGPGEFDRALALVTRHAIQLDEVLVNVILEACVALKDTKRLQGVLTLLKRSGWDLPKRCNANTYAALIKAYGSAHQTRQACDLWEDITRKQGLVPGEFVYAQMVDVLVMSGNLARAGELFQEMRRVHAERMGSSAFAIAYAMILRGHAQQKDAPRALQLYEEMKVHGVSVGVVMLNTLIDACCRVGDMGRAAELLKDMAKFDVTPDLISYSTLIKGYCVQGDLDQALELFGAMRRKGIKPDAIVFNSLLDGCARKEMPMLCEQVIEDMIAAGVQPSNYSASILIKLYGRMSDLDAAFKVLDEMPQKFGFRPNAAVYTTLMSSCTWNGRLDLAMGLRQRMLQEGQVPDEKTYSTLLRGATRTGQCEQIVTLLWEAADQGDRCRRLLLETEVVQNALQTIVKRKAWSQRGGEELLQRLRSAGYHVNRPGEAKGNYERPRREGRERGGGGRDAWWA